MIHWFRVQAESDPSPSRVRSESELSPIRVRAESEASPIRFRAESEPSPSRVQTESELSPMRALAESTTASEASPSRSSGQPEPWPSRVRVRSDPLPPPNPAGSDSEPCRRRVRAVALLTAVFVSSEFRFARPFGLGALTINRFVSFRFIYLTTHDISSGPLVPCGGIPQDLSYRAG